MILRLQSIGHLNKIPKHRKQNHTHTKEKKNNSTTRPHISKAHFLPSIHIKDCNLNEIKLLDIQLQSKWREMLEDLHLKYQKVHTPYCNKNKRKQTHLYTSHHLIVKAREYLHKSNKENKKKENTKQRKSREVTTRIRVKSVSILLTNLAKRKIAHIVMLSIISDSCN